MLGKKEVIRAGIVGLVMMFFASPAFARSIDLKGSGTALWIFLTVGAVIVLLQLVPAAILFFSFIGSASSAVLGKGKKAEEVILPGTKPAVAKR